MHLGNAIADAAESGPRYRDARLQTLQLLLGVAVRASGRILIRLGLSQRGLSRAKPLQQISRFRGGRRLGQLGAKPLGEALLLPQRGAGTVQPGFTPGPLPNGRSGLLFQQPHSRLRLRDADQLGIDLPRRRLPRELLTEGCHRLLPKFERGHARCPRRRAAIPGVSGPFRSCLRDALALPGSVQIRRDVMFRQL